MNVFAAFAAKSFPILEYYIRWMSGKKSSKKEEQRLLELQKQQEEEKKEVERRLKEERIKEMAKKSAPLVDYGLLDAYEFFLSQLAASGLPQGNIYEFAAQAMLKFEKNKILKQEKLKDVQRANQQAVKMVVEAKRSRSQSNSRVQKDKKVQLLPFKGELSVQEKDFMGIK